MIDVDQVALDAARQLTADKDVQGRAVMQCAIAAAIRNEQGGQQRAAPSAQTSPAGQGGALYISDEDRAVLQRIQDALPAVGLNGWTKGVEILERLLRDSLAARQPVGNVPSNPLLAVARRNIRHFLAKASFASSVDRFAAGQCVDVLEAAIDAPPAQAVDLGQPNEPGRTLYIDLDGVMADFDGAFPAVFGLDHRSLADDEMWGHINSHPSFFRDLPPMAGALDFFRSVEHLNPVILTACPKSNYPHVATQKRRWVRAHLSQTCMVLPVLGGRHKPLFMHHAGDVLIDDFGKNCAAWTDAGGIAIKHEGDWTATRAALALIDGEAVGNG